MTPADHHAPALVTGAPGFAGSHLLEYLAGIGEPAHAWSHRVETPAADAARSWTAVDVLDRFAVTRALDALRPSVIYHCAGAAHVADAWTSPARALRINALGTHVVLAAVVELGLRCAVLVTGSGQIYRPSWQTLDEDDPILPVNPYGVSKLAQEMIAAAAPLDVFLARPFNHAGPGQSDAFVTSAFARQLAEIEAGHREPLLRVGNLDARRDITDVRDTVRAYHAMVTRGRPGIPYNVCSGEAPTVAALLDRLIALARVDVRIEVDPARLRPSDNPVLLGSHARLTSDTGWQPTIPLERTLGDLLDYWRARVA